MARRKQHAVQPIERFPAKPRKDGRFQKRINGTLYYFGRDGDRDMALREYEMVKVQLYAGLPIVRSSHGSYANATVKDLGNRYLLDIKGELESYAQYKRYLRHFARYFRGRKWATLTTDDFTAYGKSLRARYAASSYNRRRAVILAMFNHADDQDWIDRAPKFGRGFRRIKAGDVRAERKAMLLTPDAIKALIAHATPQMRAMILLGLNGGFGPADCGHLPWSAVDLDAAFIRWKRVKNGIDRGVTLWPETVAALREIRKTRPADKLVFRTRRGLPWRGTSIAHRFQELAAAAGVDLPDGVGMYACRHTFATIANEIRDTDARRHLMGRILPNLDDVYVEGMLLKRLKVVTDHVRRRLSIAKLVRDARVRSR